MFKEKENANSILRYAILLCKGEGCKCSIRTRLFLIRMQMDALQYLNAKWQVKTLNIWIARFIKEHHDALQSPEGLKPHIYKNGGVSPLCWYKRIPDGSEGSK